MKNTQTQGQARKLKRDPRLILLILIIMLLIISQVIVLLANSASINQLPEPVLVNEQAITLDDLKAVNADLNDVRKSLNEINKKPDHIEVKKVESKPVLVPPAPVVVKKNKKNIKSKQKITGNKKVALIEKSPVVVIPVPVSSDEKTIQSIEKPAYIKHDINGKSLEDNNGLWTCVFDTKSGLMWEVKSKDDTMRNSNNLYSWFNPDNKALKGVTDGGRCKGDADCDTNAYVNEMNKQNFCGHNDWRLPTREEMMGLVSFGDGANNIKINTSYFPETLPSWYWTASSNESRPEFAWYILFKNGMSLNDLKENPKHIRLVRDEPSS